MKQLTRITGAGAEARGASRALAPPAKHFKQNILIFFFYWVVKCEEVLFYFKEMGLFIVMKRDFIFNFF
jgi:hypothetical protein